MNQLGVCDDSPDYHKIDNSEVNFTGTGRFRDKIESQRWKLCKLCKAAAPNWARGQLPPPLLFTRNWFLLFIWHNRRSINPSNPLPPEHRYFPPPYYKTESCRFCGEAEGSYFNIAPRKQLLYGLWPLAPLARAGEWHLVFRKG